MTPEQLLEAAESLLDEAKDAAEGAGYLILQGASLYAEDARPVIEYMTEMIREFVVAQTKVPKKRS